MYIRIFKARKEFDCACGEEKIQPGDKYINLRARVAPYCFIATKYTYPCFCRKLMDMMFFVEKRKHKPTGTKGRPKLCHLPVLVQVEGNPEMQIHREPLAPEQVRRRKIVCAQFSRAVNSGKDVSGYIKEMEGLGGIPDSWNTKILLSKQA